VKTKLEEFGYNSTWRVCATTDGASNVVAARMPGRFPEVGLNIVKAGTCVDHTIHLVVEDALDKTVEINRAVKTVRPLVEYLKDSNIALQAFLDISQQIGLGVISPIQGTSNRSCNCLYL
jgi:hypothetical protein